MKECECPVEHTVTKLGHNRDCPWYGKIALLTDQTLKAVDPGLALFVCGTDTCVGGLPHDFEWATYSDERMETGVCRCGLREIDHDIMRMP